MATVFLMPNGAETFLVDPYTRHDAKWVTTKEQFERYQGPLDERDRRNFPSVVRVIVHETDDGQDAPVPIARQISADPYAVVITRSPVRWTLSVTYGQIIDSSRSASRMEGHGLAWANGSQVDASAEPPEGLLEAFGSWLDRTFSDTPLLGRLLRFSEELVEHLHASLENRIDLTRRLEAALGSKQHAEDRISVLEAQVVALEAQLLEANAAIASGEARLINQSRTSLVAMATMVVSLLALAATAAQPFVSDYLSNNDTEAIVQAQRENTAAIEAMDDPSPVDLSVEAALRCIVDDGREQ